ncbi:DUF2971 domain-containing protein [Novosphingopyxis sp. YJ-S2-01]|uniref:DUF2971 domain-containing protein n=1 Tax=Novosphingopyxis sp. YJ-S2-01 TaxID=2794021 RepID=UPI0018DCA2BE|nr:DUF2971 domain-containing protein [Novosphingopyxis sp. YJ-S2-01]MBH9536969.1 DUF2971 domain-containing protein [Novosphingopyxis sp. YJ-S2-01]
MLPNYFDYEESPQVFHYTSVLGALGIIESHSIWLTEYSSLNDTQEFLYGKELYFDALKKFTDREVPKTVEYIAALAFDDLQKRTNMLISSFSLIPDDLSQWRSYADNARGCVISIDSEYLSEDAGVAIRKVVYDKAVMQSLTFASIDVLIEQYQENPTNIDTLYDYARRAAVDLFSYKHPAFASEQEVRISRLVLEDIESEHLFKDVGGSSRNGHVPSLDIQSRNGPFGDARFIALPLQKPNELSAIKAVGLGSAIDLADKQKILEAIEKLDRSIPTWQSRIPYRT